MENKKTKYKIKKTEIPEFDLSPKIEKLQKQVDKNPKSTVFFQLAAEYRKSNMAEEAVYVIEAGLEHNPTFLQAKLLLAQCYIDLNENMKAKQIVDQVLSTNMNNPVALKLGADLAYVTGDFHEARDLYEKAHAINPMFEKVNERLRELKGGSEDKKIELSEMKPDEEMHVELGSQHSKMANAEMGEDDPWSVTAPPPSEGTAGPIDFETQYETSPEAETAPAPQPEYAQDHFQQAPQESFTPQVPENQQQPYIEQAPYQQQIPQPVAPPGGYEEYSQAPQQPQQPVSDDQLSDHYGYNQNPEISIQSFEMPGEPVAQQPVYDDGVPFVSKEVSIPQPSYQMEPEQAAPAQQPFEQQYEQPMYEQPGMNYNPPDVQPAADTFSPVPQQPYEPELVAPVQGEYQFQQPGEDIGAGINDQPGFQNQFEIDDSPQFSISEQDIYSPDQNAQLPVEESFYTGPPTEPTPSYQNNVIFQQQAPVQEPPAPQAAPGTFPWEQQVPGIKKDAEVATQKMSPIDLSNLQPPPGLADIAGQNSYSSPAQQPKSPQQGAGFSIELAEFYAKLGQLEKAANVYRVMLSNDPTNQDLVARLTIIESRLNNK